MIKEGNPPPLSPSLDKGGGIGYVREASPLFIEHFVNLCSCKVKLLALDLATSDTYDRSGKLRAHGE